MPCPNENRHRPKTVAFRVSDEEDLRIEQRVIITGETKGDFLRSMALNGEININVGKYKSDKLALAIKNLSKELNRFVVEKNVPEMITKVLESQVLIEELYAMVFDDENELNVSKINAISM